MKFKVVQLSQFNGNKAGVYSVILDDEQQTLYERFLMENISAFKSEIIDVNKRIQTINRKTGAREIYFKFDEGNPGDGVCALYDEPGSKLRLYCIRYGNSLIILGSGGPKSKSIRAFQEDSKLTIENYLLRRISGLITERVRNGEILFSDDGTELYGELEFEDNEHETHE